MVEYTVCVYDLQGDIPRPGDGNFFTYDAASMGGPHGLTVEDDDPWADSLSPVNENGTNATYVSGSGEAGWTVGDDMDLNAVQILTGSDGSTITMGWLRSEQDGSHQMMTDAPLVDGVTYTQTDGTANVPGSTYPWDMFDFHATSAPCFTRGMEIKTKRGPIAVEHLVVGDMIWTLDHGYQELKFINSTRHLAQGSLVPVLFKKGTIGNTKDLIVSQKHRFHIASLPRHLSGLFGRYANTLLQAHCFCDGAGIRLYPEIGAVEYYHLMFDNHELLDCYGTISESWQPTRKAIKRNPELAEELTAIFPGIAERRLTDPGALVRSEVLFAMPLPGQTVRHR